MLDMWSSSTVSIVWELAWLDSALVVLDEWLSYRGDHIGKFDCISSFIDKAIQCDLWELWIHINCN